MLRLQVECPTCKATVLARGTPDAVIGTAFDVPLTGSRFLGCSCRFGHAHLVWLEHRFYELLLYRAYQDYSEKNYRGAVFGLYSSWDNFVGEAVDQYVRSQLTLIEQLKGKPPPELKRAEPRLGMYAAAFAHQRKQWPRLPRSESTALRNRVVHDNGMPTPDQVEALAKDVSECIRAGRDALGMQAPSSEEDAVDSLISDMTAEEQTSPVVAYRLVATLVDFPPSAILDRWPMPLAEPLGVWQLDEEGVPSRLR